MIKVFRLIVITILFFTVNIFAQNITVTAGTDTTDYLVGDYITFTIRAEYDEGIKISPPTLTDNIEPLEVIKVLPVSFEGEKGIQQFNYIISGYDSARVVIPPIPITYFIGNSSEPQTVNTNEVEIFIHTLPVNPQADIKDVKEPLRISIDWFFWLMVIIIILLLSLLAYFLYKKFKKPVEESREIRRVPPMPYHRVALKALDNLKAKKLWQQGKVKEFHSELTGIIRKYFEDRYHFNSLEMTSAETMKVINRVMDNQKMIDTTNKFLNNADMVKFAKFVPLPTVNEEMMKQAYEIVLKTKPDDEIQNGVRSV